MRHQAYDGLPTRPRLCAWHRANTSNDTRTQTNDTGCQNICEQHTSQTCESTCTTTLLYRHKLLLCTIAAGAAQTFRLSLTRTVRDRKLGRQTARSKNALFCTFTIEYISRYSQAALMKRQITFHTSRNRSACTAPYASACRGPTSASSSIGARLAQQSRSGGDAPPERGTDAS